ncbi:hypothetical protein [Rhizobium sp. 768_B6_N1_8]|uniref:hypothetical protein n=1 Tax=unclassified Rhizobium TaxID=2613769 RepID=UPI0030EFBE22
MSDKHGMNRLPRLQGQGDCIALSDERVSQARKAAISDIHLGVNAGKSGRAALLILARLYASCAAACFVFGNHHLVR